MMKKAVGVLSLLGLLIQSFCANFSDERDFVLKICRTMKQTPVKISNYKHAQYEYDTVWLSPQPDGRECARTERYNHNTGWTTVRVFKNGNAYQWVEDAQHQVQKDIVFKAENEEFGFYYFPVESLADFPASTFTVSKITYRGQPCWKILGCYEPTDENIRNYVKCKPGADSPDPAGVITGCEIIVPADSARLIGSLCVPLPAPAMSCRGGPSKHWSFRRPLIRHCLSTPAARSRFQTLICKCSRMSGIRYISNIKV